MNILETIRELTEQGHVQTLEIFEHLHRNPELSFKEFETSAYIQKMLAAWGIPFEVGYAETGIVAHIKGALAGDRVIALRADMDALPVEEGDTGTCRSMNPGVMHACGHDAHMSSLLGVAHVLNNLKQHFSGTIILIFQPGEESHPGGARLMLEQGVFSKLKPELIIGQHVLPHLPVGQIAYKTGVCMASADEIYITVRGRGGHAALPHLLNDTVLAASRVLVALQDITSRMLPAQVPTVLSFGRFIADGATNVIPNEVKLAGTLRTTDEQCRLEAKKLTRKVATDVAASMGCTCDFDIKDGFPCVVNDEKLTLKLMDYAGEYLGEGNVNTMPLRMTAEDFGFFSQAFPCTFFRFGIAGKNNVNAGDLHMPSFSVDTDALKYAVGNLAYLAFRIVNEK